MFSLGQKFAYLRNGAAAVRVSLGPDPVRLLTAHSRFAKVRFASPVLLKGTAEARRDSESRELADMVCLDLEDAVPPSLKTTMRAALAESVESGEITMLPHQTLIVRVNSLHAQPDLAIPDLHALVRPGVQMLGLAKVNHANDVRDYTQLVVECEHRRGMARGTTQYIVIVETARSFFNLADILMADDRIAGAALGREDFAAETGGDSGKWNLAYKHLIDHFVLACHATGTNCMASPHFQIDDFSGLLAVVGKAKAQGFATLWALTTNQIAIIHHCFRQRKDADGLDDKHTGSMENGSVLNTVRATHRPLALSSGGLLNKGELTVVETLLNAGQERTVHQSWCALWNMMLFNSSGFPASTSLGCGLPHNLQLVISTASAVLFSQCGKVVRTDITGMFDAVHHRAVNVGDVIRVETEIVAVRPGQDRAYHFAGAVVETSHSLVNQCNEVCFSVTVHSRLVDSAVSATAIRARTAIMERREAGSRPPPELVPECTQHFEFSPGTLLIHPHVRSFLPCDNTFLNNFFDSNCTQDGRVASSFVLCAALSNANYDIGDFVRERVDACNIYRPVTADQTMVNVSVVKSIQACEDDPRLEDVEVVTLALINVDVSDVEKSRISSTLFSRQAEVSIDELEQIVAAYCPFLLGRIVLRAVRTVTRFKSEVVAASQKSYDRKLPKVALKNGWFH